MNRLRIRVELNRRKAGVPMHELVSVVEETHKFFQLLAKDVRIEVDRGEWHASNFDPESLNFTAEFDGPASADQIHAFGSAFGGATSLRRDTIAQFTRIADYIEEDELVGFGLYQSDQENEPSEWRCLSRLDALRFADEIRLLAKDPDSGKDAPLPAVMNGSVGGRRLFKDRREREALETDPARRIREVESSLSRRIALLEGELESQTRKMQALESAPDAEEKFIKMLSAMESFWARAPERLELGAAETLVNGAGGFDASSQAAAENPAGFAPPTDSFRRPPQGRGLGLAIVSAALILAAASTSGIARLSKSLDLRRQEPATPVLPASYHAPPPVTPDLRPLVRRSETAAPIQPSYRRPAELENAQTRREATPQIANEIALDIRPELRSMVGSEVLVNVSVGIDPSGKVATAEIDSTRGAGADVLAPEALKAARGLRFRPARQSGRNVPSQTVLTFTFSADSDALLTEGQTPQN